ncbi:MAG: HU family DNA-binding protein [Dysgonamonadaceae bacterium]|jgi:predicted histone-like DNA-binding protein|nr:HU family DNA-binding protein [Dysgonamonadaceae bacterium]
MKFKLVEKGVPNQPSAPKKYYPSAVNTGKFTIKDVAKEIAGRSSLTKGDIENVLSNFMEELPTFLKLGMSVQLGDFGTTRLNLSGEGAGAPADFKTETISAKVIFTPSVELKNGLADIHYEKAE